MDWPLLQRVEAAAAVRNDQYSDFSSATSPSASLLVQPLRGLVLRGTWSKGYWVPLLSQLYRPATTGNQSGRNADPLRGNTLIPTPFGRTVVGNPDLRGQKSENQTASITMDVPYIKGLSVTGSWYWTDYTDRVQSLSTVYSIPQILTLFPEYVTRGPNLPTDQPGWSGPVTNIRIGYINIGAAQMDGWDAGLRYDRATPWGEVQMRFDVSRATKNEVRATPESEPSPNVGTWSIASRMNGSVFWTRRAWEAGALFTYSGEYRYAASAPTYPSSIRWDAQVSYDFERGGWGQGRSRGWMRSLFARTRLSLTVFNLLDRDPPLLYDFSITPIYAAIEERMMHYQLQLVKQF